MPQIAYLPKPQPMDSSSSLMAGAKAYYYITNTSSPKDTYSDFALTTPNTNPVVADGNGVFPTVFLKQDVRYRVTLKTSADVLIYTQDDIAGPSMSQAEIGLQLYPQTAAEIAAGVTPTNYAYPPGYLRRYGCTGDGATDDSTAFTNAKSVSAQGQRLYGSSGDVYLLGSQVVTGIYFDLDLQGATVKPSGNHLCFNSTVSATATQAISNTIAVGDRTCVVGSATGLATGQWTYISYNDSPTNQSVSYPPSWARITNVAGTTITFDRTFQCGYTSGASTFNLVAFADATLQTLFRVVGGTIDGSASTYSGGTLGVAARIVGYKDVLFDVKLRNFSYTVADDLITVFQCITAVVPMNDVGNGIGVAQHLNFVDVMSATASNGIIDGGGFGIGFLRCDFATAVGNHLNGRRKQENDDSVSPTRSVRGIKAYGCKHVRIVSNGTNDYESPIKVEACHGGIVGFNELQNCGLEGSFTGSNALNIGQTTNGNLAGRFLVIGNSLDNCGGNGIAITASTTVGKNIVTNNTLRRIQGFGILSDCPNSVVSGNQIEDWGLRNSGDAAIRFGSGATILGNRFAHATLTGLNCLAPLGGSLTATYRYTFRDNATESGNPLGVVMESAGTATITAAATNVTVAHGLTKTPSAEEITFTPTNNPTTDPGNEWIDTIGGTNFNLNCRTAPGVSTATFKWSAKIAMPFTA